MFLIPANPSEQLLKDFMFKHNFAVADTCHFELMLFDNIGRKVYTHSMSIKGDKQWALKIMNLIVSLRNMKKSWWKEKDHHKRRKIYSKMNYIKGELNRYENKSML